MSEIDNLEIVVTAETGDVDDSLKNLTKTLSRFNDSLAGFGSKMRVDGVETKMKSVSKAMRGEESRVKQIASDMAEDFIHNFNIKDTDVQNKIRGLSDSIFGSLKREGLQVSAGDTRDYQKQLLDSILGNGKVFSEEAAERKKILEDFYDDLIGYGRKYGTIKLPEGMKSPSFEGAPLPGNLFSKDGADFTADSFITERYKHLFSDDDLKAQEDIISRIVELTKEYRSIWATQPLGENEIKYITDSIREYGQQAINVLKEPLVLTKELKERFKDFGKDWDFKGTTSEAERNLKSLEKQLENAKQKVQGLVIKDRIVDSNAYVDAIANVQLLTNKINTLKNVIDEAGSNKLSENLTISTLDSTPTFDALDYYTERLQDFKDRFLSGNYESESGTGIEGEIRGVLGGLESDYPELENLINQYNHLLSNLFPESDGLTQNIEPIVHDLEFFEIAYQELLDEFRNDNLGALDGLAFPESLNRLFNELHAKYPDAYQIIQKYTELWGEYQSAFKTSYGVFPEAYGIVFSGSKLKENIDSVKNSIISLKKESMNLSSAISRQKNSGYSKAFIEMEKEVKRTIDKLAQLQSQMLKGLAGKEKFEETENFQILDQQIKDTTEHLEQLKSEMSGMNKMAVPDLGKSKSQSQTQGILTQLKSSDVLVALRKELLIVSAIIKSVEKAAKGLWGVLKTIGRGMKAIGNAIVSPFRKLHAAFKDMIPTSDHLLKSLIRNWKMFRLMITRSILRGIINLGKNGFQNLVRYSDECNRSFSMLWNSIRQLGNSVAAMASPLLNALAPALNQIIQLAIRATNAINQLISALLGRGTWIKAKELTDDYAASLGSVNKQLAGIDELNNLTTSGSGGTNPKDMFETLPIEQKWEDLSKKIKGILERLFDPLKASWEKWKNPFQASYKYMFNEIKKLIQSIGRDWMRVWEEPKTQKIFENIILAIGNIINGIGNIAKNLRIAWYANDNGYKILSAIRDVISVISDKVKLIAQDFSKWTQKLDFSPLLSKMGPFIESLTGPVGFLTEAFRTFIRDVLEPLGKWVLEKGLPQLFEIITKLNNDIDWNRLNTMLSAFWKTLEKFGEKVGQGLIDFIKDLTQSITDWLNNGGYEKLEEWLGNIQSWMNNTTAEDVTTILNDVFDVLTDIATALGTVAEWIVKLMASDSLGGMYDNVNKVKDAIKFFADKLTDCIEPVKQLKDNISLLKDTLDLLFGLQKKSTFGNDSKSDFTKAKDSADSAYNTIKKLFDLFNPMNWKTNLANWVASFVSSFDAVSEAAGKIAPSLANAAKGFVAGGFPTGRSIPSYATGGFPEDGLFYANHSELLGQFSNGRTAVVNNEQILLGIENGVSRAVAGVVAPYLQQLVASNNEIASKDIEVSSGGIFKTVRNEAKSFSRMTGQHNAFTF